MKAVVINSCIKKERTDVLHHYLFHGDDYRQSNQTEIDLNHPLGDDLSLPTVIDRSGLYFPQIIMPGTSLVVDENIRNQLAPTWNIQFAPVKMGKLVACWYPAGDFSFYDEPFFIKDPYKFRSDKILEWLPDTPRLHKKAPNYYEIVAVNSFKAAQEATTKKTISFELTEIGLGPDEFDYCTGLLEKHPIIWGRAVVIRKDVFDLICNEFDWDYFTMTEIVI